MRKWLEEYTSFHEHYKKFLLNFHHKAQIVSPQNSPLYFNKGALLVTGILLCLSPIQKKERKKITFGQIVNLWGRETQRSSLKTPYAWSSLPPGSTGAELDFLFSCSPKQQAEEARLRMSPLPKILLLLVPAQHEQAAENMGSKKHI